MKICPRCNTLNADNACYCEKCGNDIKGIPLYNNTKASKRSPKRRVILLIISFCLIIGFSVFVAESDRDTKQNTIRSMNSDKEKLKEKKNYEKKKNNSSTEETAPVQKEDAFLTNLKTVLDPTVSETAYDILKNQIGFSKLEYVSKMGETSNYEIKCDGIDMVLTASDKVYRIFIPNSSYVFYEDDTVKLTAKQYSDRTIDYDKQSRYYIMATDIVSSVLADPSSADFPSVVTNAGEIAMQRNGSLVAIQSYVDSNNYYGQKVRSNFTVEFVVTDMDSFAYEVKYINVDGQTSGEFIDIDSWSE